MDLYYMPTSPPCRAVLMAAKGLGIELNLKLTNVLMGENRTPEYLRMNIQHTIPTLDDDGFVLNESRAILQYLANKYATQETQSLYPKDPEARALVDMRLFFDMGTLHVRLAEAYYPVIFAKVDMDDKLLEKLDEALGFLEEYVKFGGYVAGNNLTIADYAVIATLSTIEAFDHDLASFPKVQAYLERCKGEIEGYQENNGDGVQLLAGWAKPALCFGNA